MASPSVASRSSAAAQAAHSNRCSSSAADRVASSSFSQYSIQCRESMAAEQIVSDTVHLTFEATTQAFEAPMTNHSCIAGGDARSPCDFVGVAVVEERHDQYRALAFRQPLQAVLQAF